MAKARILVVDDEYVARLSLLRILQLEGFEVTAVGDGDSALRELARSTFDLMILDLKLAGMSGIDVVTRTMDLYPNLKVIILTAYGSMDTAIQALRYHVNDYLIKPAVPKDILKSVERVLKGETSLDSQQVIRDARAGYRVLNLANQPYEQTVFHAADGVVIDCMRRRITREDTIIYLTPTEAKVMGVLLENNSLVVTHQELVNKAYGYRVGAGEAAKILRPVLSRLNSKLEKIPGGENWIRSIRGTGYLLEIDRAARGGETPAVKN